MSHGDCAVGCMPICGDCHKPKKPVGRDQAAATVGAYCAWDCPGYLLEPTPCDLWPGENRESEEG